MSIESIANLLKEFKKLSVSERKHFLSVIESESSPMDDKVFVDMKSLCYLVTRRNEKDCG